MENSSSFQKDFMEKYELGGISNDDGYDYSMNQLFFEGSDNATFGFTTPILDKKGNETGTSEQQGKGKNEDVINSILSSLSRSNAEQKRKQQKKSKTQRNEKKKNSENDKNIKYVSKLDLWNNTEYLFGDIPSDSEIEEMFSKMNRIELLKELVNKPRGPAVHWSERFAKYMKNSAKMLKLPHQQNPYQDKEEFWEKNNVGFQVEECQKKKLSTLHHLLNSFVIISIDEVKEKDTPKETHEFVPFQYPIIPEIKQSSNYISYIFEDRLEFELQSLGLSKKDECGKVSPFEAEIKFKMDQLITDIVPKLSEFKKEIKNNIENYRKDKQRRDLQIRKSYYLSNIVKQSYN